MTPRVALAVGLLARMNFPPPLSAFPTISDTINDNKNDGNGDNDDSNFSWPSYEALKRYIYARLSPHRSHIESSPHGAPRHGQNQQFLGSFD
jgi:hypothetical protein